MNYARITLVGCSGTDINQLTFKIMAIYKVTFKESYMPHEVERTCDVPSRKDVIDLYGLEEKDIEWYKIEEI